MCNGCHEASTFGCDGWNMRCHAYAPLKELVEKATPKKLDSLYYLVHKKYDEYYVTGHCLVCGNEFNISKNNRPNYCPHCGQKIDWGEKDCSDCASRLKTWLEQEHESSFSEEEKLMLESLKRRSYSFIVYYSDYGEAWAYECYPDLNSRWDRARGHKELRLLEGMFKTLKSNKVYRIEDLLER